MKVKNKKIVVTGAGSGIGRELTLQLTKKGAYVIAVDINENNLNETIKLANSSSIDTYVLDVSNKILIENFVRDCLSKHEYIDGLINNAGIIQPFTTVNELDEITINRIMNVNFYGPLNLVQLFLPSLLKRKEGSIVNVSSMGGFFPFPKQTIYGASKAAIKLFTEGLYAELIDTNISVTVVFPGAIATNIAANSNVSVKTDGSASTYKMTSANKAASEIIKAIEKKKFQLYIGSDSKMMNFMYKMSPKRAIKMISKKMKDL
ncbi:MAG: SDR family oxidoreductase [Bacilli bacterium]|nr:SDR family oxidoreductase [Bacilli bacterium]